MAWGDIWAIGERYEPYVGRWSRLLAPAFLAWLAVPPGARWLDVGCGTGALSEAILAACRPAAVAGIDPSEGFIGYAKTTLTDPRARFETGDALAIDAADGAFDAVVAGLVLNQLPDAGRAVDEMTRVTRPGGIVGAYVWDYASGMEMMRCFWDVAAPLDEASVALDEGKREPALCLPGPLTRLFGERLAGIEVEGIVIPTRFRDFEDYWRPFLGEQGVAPSYLASQPAGRVAELREAVRARLPIAADGSIALTARAWAVKGTKRAG